MPVNSVSYSTPFQYYLYAISSTPFTSIKNVLTCSFKIDDCILFYWIKWNLKKSFLYIFFKAFIMNSSHTDSIQMDFDIWIFWIEPRPNRALHFLLVREISILLLTLLSYEKYHTLSDFIYQLEAVFQVNNNVDFARHNPLRRTDYS